MGWFKEQIQERTASDQRILEESLLEMASVVLDKWNVSRLDNERLVSQQALDEILKYFREKPVNIPEKISDFTEQLEYALRPSGIMIREVHLEEGWQNDGFGPLLGFLKDSDTAVALIPSFPTGYHFRDPETGKKVRVSRKNAGRFALSALCFYRPLPMKSLGTPDLIRFMWKNVSTGDLALIVLATLAVTLVGLLEPKIYSLLTGPVLNSHNVLLLNGLAMFLLCVAFSSKLLSSVKSLLMNRISTKTSMAVEASVMMRILSLPVSFFRGFSSGELASRASSIKSLCSTILSSILSTGLTSLLSLIYVFQIFQFAPALVLPSLIIVLVTVTLSVTASFLQIRISRERMTLEAKEEGMSYSLLTGVQKIRLSGSEKRAFARWGKLFARSARLQYNPPTFLKLNRVIITAVTLIGTLVMYYVALKSSVSASDYYAFNAAYGRVSGAFNALAGIAITIAGIKPMLEMAEPIMKAEPEVTSEKEALTSITGSIEVSHVSFRYDENTPYIMKDLSLRIKAGEYVAIVGRTGCGKSTLVRLLLGFEKPEKGAIFYDRYDLNSVDPRSLRRNIGVVMQSGSLFQGDIFSNITISAPQLTLQDAWAAAELAGIADDIREMPMGMQTLISEGQGGISGGQKQRLMIARAVAPKPRVLIFDEATSALDNITQKKVSDALDGLKCTRIVIAHRLSTIRNCDRILVMDNGAIIEEGSYEELIARKGVFADLVERQRLDTGDAEKQDG